jgi:hypothetical protein
MFQFFMALHDTLLLNIQSSLLLVTFMSLSVRSGFQNCYLPYVKTCQTSMKACHQFGMVNQFLKLCHLHLLHFTFHVCAAACKL